MKLVRYFVFTLMSATALSSAALAQLGGPAPPDREPLSNAFIRASETVLDDIQVVDLTANPTALKAQMDTVKTAQHNLATMAETERESIALSVINDAIFALRSCSVIAADGQDTTACRQRITRSQAEAMEAIDKHRENGAWVDGLPQ
jgi:hypothetical protein